jgi:hypothetical protein
MAISKRLRAIRSAGQSPASFDCSGEVTIARRREAQKRLYEWALKKWKSSPSDCVTEASFVSLVVCGLSPSPAAALHQEFVKRPRRPLAITHRQDHVEPPRTASLPT